MLFLPADSTVKLEPGRSSWSAAPNPTTASALYLDYLTDRLPEATWLRRGLFGDCFLVRNLDACAASLLPTLPPELAVSRFP